MLDLTYDEVDRLTACAVCGSLRCRLEGELCQSWKCVAPLSEGMIRVDPKVSVN
jgi:hypothetical protein